MHLLLSSHYLTHTLPQQIVVAVDASGIGKTSKHCSIATVSNLGIIVTDRVATHNVTEGEYAAACLALRQYANPGRPLTRLNRLRPRLTSLLATHPASAFIPTTITATQRPCHNR